MYKFKNNIHIKKLTINKNIYLTKNWILQSRKKNDERNNLWKKKIQGWNWILMDKLVSTIIWHDVLLLRYIYYVKLIL